MTTMKTAIEKILDAHKQLDPFRSHNDYSVKIENSGFMPLTVEKHGEQVVVAHYFEQNGDLVPDPDMEFYAKDERDWVPVAIQHATGHYVRSARIANGIWLFEPGAVRELNQFSRMWARNLLAQGFASGRVIRAEAI